MNAEIPKNSGWNEFKSKYCNEKIINWLNKNIHLNPSSDLINPIKSRLSSLSAKPENVIKNLEIAHNNNILTEDNFEKVFTQIIFIYFIKDSKPETLEFLEKNDYLKDLRFDDSDISQEIQRSSIRFLSEIELKKIETFLDLEILIKEELDKPIEDCIKSLLVDHTENTLKKYLKKELIDINSPFVYGNYKVLKSLEEEGIFNPDDGKQVSAIQDLLKRNNGMLTPILTNKWLEITKKNILEEKKEEEKGELLKKFEQMKKGVLYANKDKNINYEDDLALEAIKSLYVLNLSLEEIKNLLGSIEHTDFKIKAKEKYSYNITQYSKVFNPNNAIPPNILSIHSSFQKKEGEGGDSSSVFVEVLKLFDDQRVKNYSQKGSEFNPSTAQSLREILSIIPKEDEFESFLRKNFASQEGSAEWGDEQGQEEMKNIRQSVIEFLKNYDSKVKKKSSENNFDKIIRDLEAEKNPDSALSLVKNKQNLKSLAKNIVFNQSTKEATKVSKLQILKNRLILEKAKKEIKNGGEITEMDKVIKAIIQIETEPVLKNLNDMMSDIKKEKTGEIELDFVVTKTKAGFFGKHAAEICTANNTKMYNKPYHYHINMIHGGKVVGNIMLYMFNEEEEEEEENPEFADYVIARGFNPTNEFIRKTNPQELVKNIIEVLKDIATKNDRQAIYVPVQDEYRSLSNRDLISKELAKIAQQSRQENTSLPNQLETELNVNEDNTTEPLQLFKKTI